jgi:predicted GNAT family acetyltransferase
VPMELWIGFDADRFAARAQAFLEARVQRNVLATTLAGVRAGRYHQAIFAIVSDEHVGTVAVAIRTPPHLVLAAGAISEPDAFMAAWLGIDPACPGVSAEPDLARALARAWSVATQGHSERHVSEALHVLEAVTAPDPPVPGTLSLADFRDNAQLGEWGIAFAVDSGLAHPESAHAAIAHSLRHRRVHVWDRDGLHVSMVGHNEMVAGTVRVGPVYTPPQLRGRGYATAATAAVSQLLLEQGAERCMLYTDLANPIANHVYAKIGYRRLSEWEEHRFIRRD